MNSVQRYLFYAVLRTVVLIVGGLALLALLAQGLSQTDLLVENRQSALTYFFVVLLGAPQVMALLLPLAVFIATIWSLNRLHKDSEIVVAQAAGMTKWQTASPVLRLAVLAAIVQLGVNLWVQPSAQREMRETITEARADLITSLVKPGAFTSAADRLTIFTRDISGGVLQGIYISDQRDPSAESDYLARRGTVVEVDGAPAIIMDDGQIHQTDQNGALSILAFDQYQFDLTPFMKERGDVVLKASDRFLWELFYPDMSNYLQRQDADRYLAEGHARLTMPLISIVMAMIAISAVLGGDFSRRGYSRRIVIAVTGAIVLLIIQLSLQAASVDEPALNAAQYIVPAGIFLVLLFRFLGRGGRRRSLRTVRRREALPA
jgi:lipopolysaccharide export system permease protein